MATEAQPATQTKRILIVEDEVMIRMLLEDMLGELGYTVAAEAARIDEALEATKISTASRSRRLPMPSLPAARRSSLRRAMASWLTPIATGQR
jgi:CheY-like chemotaxis protein